MKGKFELLTIFEKLKPEQLYISEITLAELKYGIECSEYKVKNKKTLDNFLTYISILPIFHSINLYAREKFRLRKSGITIDEFDLLIGVTSITHQMYMVTNNTKHFKHLKGIQLEDWTV